MGRSKFVGQGERTRTVTNGKGGNFHNGIVNDNQVAGSRDQQGLLEIRRCWWYRKRWWHWGFSPSGICAWNRAGGCGENEKDERINGKDGNGKQQNKNNIKK